MVRLEGWPRVEVFEPGQAKRVYRQGESLQAPGILRNPVKVEALYDPDAAFETTLRNLLQRKGYHDLAAVRAEGEAKGKSETLRNMVRVALERRLGPLPAATDQALDALPSDQLEALFQAQFDFADLAALRQWLVEAR